MKALLILNRLPTSNELETDCADCELDTFNEDFNNTLVTAFIAEVDCTHDEHDGIHIELGDGGWRWQHNPDVDWYSLKIV